MRETYTDSVRLQLDLQALELEAMLEDCVERRNIQRALHFGCIGSS
jgi:hypothetical protein